MPFLPDALTKIKNLVSAVLHGLAQNVLEKIPEEKRRLFMIGAGGGLAVLLLVFIGALIAGGRASGGYSRAETSASVYPVEDLLAGERIPPEELFLPDEPDFVPGVLLGRERRSVWTAEDAAPYWRDPLKKGEEQWREWVEAIADELLERAP
jgi:hypothetical protein